MMADQRLLDIAVQAAKAAGRILHRNQGSLQQINFTDAHDVKLQADIDSEILIRNTLSETGLPIIGEEQGGDVNLLDQHTPYWVVDPLDGTYNYLRNIPLTAVSIGLMQGTRPLLGVIYQFSNDLLYSGGPSLGFFINGEPTQPSWAQSLEESVICCGFPASYDMQSSSLQAFITRLQAFKKVRMIGSAALALAYVASGQADTYYEESIRLWDVAAGLALVEAAGGNTSLQLVDKGKLSFNVWGSGLSAKESKSWEI